MNGSPRSANRRQQQRLAPVVGATGILALIGLGLAWAAYVRRYVLHGLPLTAALSGDVKTYKSEAGQVAYYTAGNARRNALVSATHAAPPILFLHGIGATASSYEMKPLYEHYARERRVYALDLPGFGFSERSLRTYTPDMYRDVILEFIQKELKTNMVDAVAQSLSCEFLAQAAMEKPERFRTLTFISPTGMSMGDMRVTASDRLLRILLHPAWSRLIFDTATSRPGIAYSMQHSQSNRLNRAFAQYAYLTSHQPNAQVAPFFKAAGMLHTPAIFMVYQKLTQPVLMVYGRNRTSRYDMANTLHAKPNWRVVPFNRCGDLVQIDDPQGVITQMDLLYNRA